MRIKLNPVYKSAKQSRERYRIVYGGSGSGKSHYIGQEILISMLESGDYKYLAIRKVARTIKDSVFRLLESLISEYNLAEYFYINKTDRSIRCVTGSELITSGLDDVEKLKSIADINRIWIEEASEITGEDFTQLDLRLRGQSKIGFQMTMTFNPISDTHWLKKRFFDVGMADSFILKTTYHDNRFIDEQYRQTLESLKERDYQYYKIYCLGEWGTVGNLIYTNWERQDLTEQIPTFDNIFNGLDFGFSQDPTAYVRLHLDKTRKKIYIFDELYETEKHIDDLAEVLREKIGKERITCDSSEPRSIADLKRHGINAIGAKKGAGSVEHGIKWIQGYKVIIHEECINAINEISGYKYKEDRYGNVLAQPVDIDNHILDAIRYSLEEEFTHRQKWGWGK